MLSSLRLPALLAICALCSNGGPAPADDIDIPYEKFVLDNGLTLIVHEDHKAPIVAVNVWYHVGSKNERPGKTGFAHLFEHLMFNGSENLDDDWFVPLERIGATDVNGTTSEDRTNYFQNVPSTALDVILWLESDRMGHFTGAITQEKLDEQRGVVQNEKRQRVDNAPYGRWWETMVSSVFPKGHPYSWPVIGSMEDLDAATVDDVREWFETYYGAANACVVIAGDVDTRIAHQKVQEYFGDIPSGPTLKRQEVWIPKRTGVRRQVLQDRVPQARLYMVWNIPENVSAEVDHLDLASDLLALGKTSRLYKRLVYDDQIATGVKAYLDAMEIGGLFVIEATAQPGCDLAAVEEAIHEELERFLRKGPTAKELERVRTQHLARFVRGLERIGGFGGKSDILARSEVFGGSPDFYKRRLERVRRMTVSDVQASSQQWLSDGLYILEVHPFPQYTAAESGVDRTALPQVDSFPEVAFPQRQSSVLSNGLRVVVARRSAVPVVRFRLLVDAGYAADQFGTPGAARLGLDMMDEGTKSRSALEISEELSMLGAELSTTSNLDMSVISLSSLTENLDPSLQIFADVILNPSFPEPEFKRLQKDQIARIQREKKTPIQMALRVFPRLLYGADHAYGTPFTGSGTEESVADITRGQLQGFHDAWVRPNNSTLVIVGPVELDAMTAKLEKLLKKWTAKEPPIKNVSVVEHKQTSEVYIVDRPGSAQSIILAGHLAPPKANPDEIAIEAMNGILGGEFSARINMNLREDKGWSYGARSVLVAAGGQRPFIVYASVQTDKTRESMMEIQKELEGIAADAPPTAEELARVKNASTLTLPGRWETAGAVATSIAELIRFRLPDDYWSTYAAKVRALDLQQVSDAAVRVLHPDRLVWIVVGDRGSIEAGIRELDYGEVRFIDADGNPQ